MLLTDIVDATSRAASLGDARWRDLLSAHDAAVRREVDRFGGREVKTIGDAFLVTFDSAPSQALRCAKAIIDTVHALGLEVRAGLHTGECELIGEDVGGMAVHIAARVVGAGGAGRGPGLGHRHRHRGRRRVRLREPRDAGAPGRSRALADLRGGLTRR